MTGVVVDQVSYRYTRAKNAICDVSFEIPDGALLGVFGPNGAGKSTLLQCVAGLVTPATGAVRIGGTSSADRALIENGTVTFVSEATRLPTDSTLGALMRWIAPLHTRWNANIASSLSERFQLDANRRIGTFSRGEYLKAALLCALATQPRVLILDEPFAGIEVATRDDIVRGLIASANANGTTVLLASHDVDEVSSLLTHVAVLVRGSLQVSGSVEEVGERFSQITMVAEDAALDALQHEQPWRHVERSGRLLRVISDARHTPVDEAMLVRRYAGASSLTVDPLPVREVVAMCSREVDAAPRMQAAA